MAKSKSGTAATKPAANIRGPVQPAKGPHLEPHQVILRPLVTEKVVLLSALYNQYAFEVNPLATKSMIRHAIETLYDVKVDKVATQTRRGKTRRYRFKFGKTKGWKRAVVRLMPDYKIELY